LFYDQRTKKQWKQLWVIDAGLIKENQPIEELQDGGVPFRAKSRPRRRVAPGSHHAHSLARRWVHQVIEISRHAGKTWETVFDAEYRRPR
jgi:hypothetical protein